MKNDNMKKNGQFLNVRVEYGFGAVWKVFELLSKVQKYPKRFDPNSEHLC